MKQKICDFDVLSERSCKEFVVESAADQKEAFLVFYEQACYVYENSCPHTGVNLNWQKEQFFSFDGLYLQCSLHGALFEPDSGMCIHGPCQGQRLKKFEIIIEQGTVYLAR